MIEYLFKPSRKVGGKRIVSRVWCGRYSLGRGQKPQTVFLNTPDEMTARKRLRDIIVEKQREQEGIIAPRAVREAASAPLSVLIAAYESDLKARDLRAGHVVATVRRLLRMAREMKLARLWDIDAAKFTEWRGGLKCAAKTKKEYQVSMNAFLRWLVATRRLLANPLAGVPMIDTRGREVRRRRALTKEEIARLLAVAGTRRLSYLFLLYTGFRYREAWGVRWCDLVLDSPAPFVRLERTNEIKDREGRVVPLHRGLAAELRSWREQRRAAGKLHRGAGDRVFRGVFPSQKDALGKDLAAAGIEKKNERGVIDWHAFRKTFGTLAAISGVGLRSTQEMLGHSTPALTASAYTDASALNLRGEVGKLPWFGGVATAANDAQLRTQNAGESVRNLVKGLISALQAVEYQQEWWTLMDSNRRMRKTARPVVWEPYRAQSR